MPLLGTLAAAGAVALAAVVGAIAGAPTDLSWIPETVIAVTGLASWIGTLIVGKRNRHKAERAEEAASYLTGFRSLVDELRQELNRLKGELQDDRKRLDECEDDRADLHRKLDCLERKVN